MQITYSPAREESKSGCEEEMKIKLSIIIAILVIGVLGGMVIVISPENIGEVIKAVIAAIVELSG